MTTWRDTPTRKVNVGGVDFAYRELGTGSGVPVVFLHHLTAVLDDWDPRIVDGIAEHHRVIAFDNRGVGATGSSVPDTVEQMGTDAIAFIRAIGLDKVDLFGFSLGGAVAQMIALQQPQLVRRMILAGTGPRGGGGIDKMATIVGAVAASHTPTIGFAHDASKQTDPVWAPIFEAFEPSRQWLAEQKPDALVVVYNDHISSFFLDHYSAFSLGVGERFEVADEGGGVRGIPAIDGHPALAAHIGASVMADSFDLSFFQGRPLDHGCFSPLSVLLPLCSTGWNSRPWAGPCQVTVLTLFAAAACSWPS